MENTLENKMRYLQAHRNEVLLPDESKFTPYAVDALFQAANMPYFTIAEYGEMTHEDYKRRELIKELHVIKRSLRQMEIVDVLAVGDVLLPTGVEKLSMSARRGYVWPSGNVDYKEIACIEIDMPVNMIWDHSKYVVLLSPNGAIYVKRAGEDRGGALLEDSTQRHDLLQAYQVLQQKGYALPWMGMSAEKLVRYGWVKLQDMSGCEYVI